MRNYRPCFEGPVLSIVVTILLLAAAAWGQNATLLYTFSYSSGSGASQLIRDTAGSLYGTGQGGLYNGGTAFMLSSNANGSWSYTTLHSFGAPSDGAYPNGGLVMDQAGNLYGSTCAGGAYRDGIVYELSPAANGLWIEKLVYPYNLGQACDYPDENTLAIDTAGNLYGVAAYGGSQSMGTLFQLSPQSNGQWKYTVVHNFGRNSDGAYPLAGPVVDAGGKVYGTTWKGGTLDLGVVYKLAPVAGGLWKEIIIHNFNGEDGRLPLSGVTLDSAGNVYGTTEAGGKYGAGTLYQLSPGNNGTGWVRNVIHQFAADGIDGGYPFDNLTLDAAGNIYGTTRGGGPKGDGILFEFSPNGDGTFSSTILRNFSDSGALGGHPYGAPVLDSAGNLLGTTSTGAANGLGAAYEIIP